MRALLFASWRNTTKSFKYFHHMALNWFASGVSSRWISIFISRSSFHFIIDSVYSVHMCLWVDFIPNTFSCRAKQLNDQYDLRHRKKLSSFSFFQPTNSSPSCRSYINRYSELNAFWLLIKVMHNYSDEANIQHTHTRTDHAYVRLHLLNMPQKAVQSCTS